MNIIDGKKIAQKIRKDLKKKILLSPIKPGLGVILVGNDPASKLYVSLKERACREAGIKFKKILFPAKISTEKIIKQIALLNRSKSIHGIIVQLPLPLHLPTNKIIDTIDPLKDVDGFHPKNIQKIMGGKKIVEPVLTKAIWQLIRTALKNKNGQGLKCAILGKSDVFLFPLQIILKNKGLDVDRFNLKNIKVKNLKKYDIVVVAVGRPDFLNGSMFKKGAIVIDVGINKSKNGQIIGDVNFSTTLSVKGWITPVPGGVGPLTVAMLLENTYLLFKKQYGLHKS
ncbi:MAG: Bifunctional protein FolD [Candidatus Magasanikbacteria bacterium GW2011_GWC2_40_17]|uniref:Bifunctional protein FolD n=1 Tax=Candidatus Magasanikbacteria bacterium GW2011_GWA2_42_32 TaxID=1619039 RepID=A0A0G1A7C6_9BACT|nr:MAG: Bifunctional protein FolD [Candidatus Magasanikbacteria bacterium GW2011_GWC2_40_17]KKS56925.1 MAG: Bifunctional protein FolD [Candidatus Magasanikbacteria bacterium GW2011_GWA2_42_32]OGH85505.1 MAG: hypothetical protein A2294_03170 [Candidatus Magasanikbacteria bacterium RIFOXYB2_FULL_38_10]